jgi:DNA-directed RNA polymerase subunit beta'
MRTFHTGGVAGVDITSGLPRVEELFEARIPKLAAPIAEIDGVVEIIDDGEGKRIRLLNEEVFQEPIHIPEGYELLVKAGAYVESGMEIARPAAQQDGASEDGVPALAPLRSPMDGQVAIKGKTLTVVHRDTEERTYPVSPNVRLLVEPGQRVAAGTALAEGPLNPQEVLRIRGKDAVQRYLVDEVQRVYRSQGVVIHDKHIEIIARQMLRRVRIDSPGDTEFLQGELVDRFLWQSVNAKVIAEGGEPSTAQTVLLGVTKVSLSTESFLAAASFQETTRVLTEAALFGKVDRLLGLKENVIIGRLIPARFDAGREKDLLPPVATATALAEPGTGGDGERETFEFDTILDAAREFMSADDAAPDLDEDEEPDIEDLDEADLDFDPTKLVEDEE